MHCYCSQSTPTQLVPAPRATPVPALRFTQPAVLSTLLVRRARPRPARRCTATRPFSALGLLLHGLEVLQHGLRIGHLEGVRARVLGDGAALDEDLLDLHVVNHARVAPRALAEAALRVPHAGHPHAAGKEGGAVRQKFHLREAKSPRGLVLLEALLEAPLTHDKGVVHREAVDLINPKRLDLLVRLLVAREVRTGGNEGCTGRCAMR
mmetsp:Transcript_27571/g.81047  ORF Transcript_27571/g.81047 Transcript_27571/m.81047 type:complete len:208 (-) Transcript_27571:88-711(-)